MADEQEEDAMFERLAASLRAVRQDAELVRTSGADGLADGLARAEAELRSLATAMEALRNRIEQQDAATVRLEAAAATSQAELRDLHEAVAFLGRRLQEQAEPTAARPAWKPPRRAALRIGMVLTVLVLAFVTAGVWVASGREPTLGTLAHEIVVRLSELIGIDFAGPAGPAQSGPLTAQITPPATGSAALVPTAATLEATSAPAIANGLSETRTVAPSSPSIARSPVAGIGAGTPAPPGGSPVSPEPASAAAGLPPAEPAATVSGLAETANDAPHPPDSAAAVPPHPLQTASASSGAPSQSGPAAVTPVVPIPAAPSQEAQIPAIPSPGPQVLLTPAALVHTSSAEPLPGATIPAAVPQPAVQAAFSSLSPRQADAPETPARQPSASAESPARSTAAEPPPSPPQKPVAAASPVVPSASAAPPSPAPPAIPAAPPIAASGLEATAAAQSPLSSQSAHQLLMRATADSWVQVRRTSGAVLLRRILKPGESWAVPAEPGLILDVGNVGGVALVVDGVPTRLTGASGGVVHNIVLDANLLASGAVVPLGH